MPFNELIAAEEISLNFIFRGDELLVKEDDLSLPNTEFCNRIGITPDLLQPLSLQETSAYHTRQVARDTQAPEGYHFRKLRALLGEWSQPQGALAGRAFQLSEWVRTHQYCGVCATPMQRQRTEFCFRCPSCGMSAYPRVSPAMMVLIKRDRHILLARHANYAQARYTALAGFVEAGENIEDAVHREVMEEVGLCIKNLRYFGSQSWPFPHSLMIAFTADYASGDICLQDDELADAQWFDTSQALPDIPMPQSIAGKLIRANIPQY